MVALDAASTFATSPPLLVLSQTCFQQVTLQEGTIGSARRGEGGGEGQRSPVLHLEPPKRIGLG